MALKYSYSRSKCPNSSNLDSMALHRAAVEPIALKVQEFYSNKQRFRISHGSSSSTRRPVDASSNTFDTSALTRILEIDPDNKIAVVEANVPMDALLEATLKVNLMPLVVTEFPGITAGGAFSGTAGESSSFRHGYFDSTVEKVEMVLGNGEVVECSTTKNQEIFKGAPGALGTLGVVTLLHVRLQKAAKWVEVTYHPVGSIAEAVEKVRKFFGWEIIDYLDGMMFSATKGAIVTGQLRESKTAGLPVQRFSGSKDPWYYLHVEERISWASSGADTHKELVPLPDYILRYNRGCFWCGKSIFDLTGLPFTKTSRRLLDFMLRTRMLYKMLQAQDPTTLMVIQDLALPFSAAEEFVNWQKERFDIWPLWLCPLRVSLMPTLHPHPLDPESKSEDLMLNIGLYGVSPQTYEEWVLANQDLEGRVSALGGMKWAYAAQLYREEQFWAQYDREWYGELREKCHATALPDIHEKTRVDVEAGRATVRVGEEYWERRRSPPTVVLMRKTLSLIWISVKSRAWRRERHSVWRDWESK